MVAAADIDPDNASILVCGGGGVALQVTKKLKDMGSWVWMMQVGRQSGGWLAAGCGSGFFPVSCGLGFRIAARFESSLQVLCGAESGDKQPATAVKGVLAASRHVNRSSSLAVAM